MRAYIGSWVWFKYFFCVNVSDKSLDNHDSLKLLIFYHSLKCSKFKLWSTLIYIVLVWFLSSKGGFEDSGLKLTSPPCFWPLVAWNLQQEHIPAWEVRYATFHLYCDLCARWGRLCGRYILYSMRYGFRSRSPEQGCPRSSSTRLQRLGMTMVHTKQDVKRFETLRFTISHPGPKSEWSKSPL